MIRKATDLPWLLLLRTHSSALCCNSSKSPNKLSQAKLKVQPEKNACNEKALRRDHEWRMGTQQRGEEIKKPPLWLAELMKPRSLLCCLIVCKIKMELSSQISDVSGDLVPQQLFGIQQGSSAFFLGLAFPSAWSSAFPAGRSSLFSVPTCLPNRLTLAQGLKNYWSGGGEKKEWMLRHTKRFGLNVSKGSYCQILAAPPQSLQLLALHFPLSYPHSEAPSQEKESRFWGMNHLLNTSLHETLFFLETQ